MGFYAGLLFQTPSLGAQTPRHLQDFQISPLQRGEFLLLSKKPGEALKIFQELWQKEPLNAYAVRGIVRSYKVLNQMPRAETLFKEYRQRNPRSSAAAYGLGYLYYLDKKYDRSRNALEEAVGLDPQNALALNNLAAVLVELNKKEEAVARVKEAIAVNPDELMFYRNLHMIYAQTNAPDKFVEEYRTSLKESLPQARNYGLVLAEKLRQKSFREYSDGKVDVTINTIVDMLQVYREIDHKPGIVSGLFSLAILYEEQGKRDLALEKHREVLKINPQHIQSREMLRRLAPEKK